MLDSSSDGVIGLVLPDLPRGGEPSRLEELAMRICEGNVKEKGCRYVGGSNCW